MTAKNRPAKLKFRLNGRFWGDEVPDRETFDPKEGDFGEIFGAFFRCFTYNI